MPITDPMARWEVAAGRVACAVGASAGIAHLAWRAATSLDGAPPWVALPAYAVELVGVLATLVLTWAMWARAEPGRPADLTAGATDAADAAVAIDTADAADVAVVVTIDRRDVAWLRATVIAARRLGPITVVDLAERDEVRAFAEREGLGYVQAAPGDLNGLAAVAASCTTAAFLHLEAGDVPHPQILERTRPLLAADVAVVQSVGVTAAHDSAEHVRAGHHLRDAERSAMNPSLGERGVAAYLGSGALVRTAALRGVDPGTSSPAMARASATASLFEQGWRIVTPGREPLVALDPVLDPNDAEVLHSCEASAARASLLGRSGVLRSRRLTLDQRLAMSAWAIRPLSGVRRTVVLALLLDALLSGRLPFQLSLPLLAATWLPWFACSAVGLHLLSARTLRPGDRSRASFRALGTSWRGVMTPNGRPERPRHVVGPAFGLRHGVAPSGAVAALSVVIALRGSSDRFTHTLEPLGGAELALVLAAALWSLWTGLDALRLLARRTQSREAPRVAASLPCTVLDHAAVVVDLTALGAGVLSDVEAQPGDGLTIEVVLATSSGVSSARIPAVVRNVREDVASGAHRLGVQFGAMDAYVADTLAEFCVVQPGLQALGTAPPDEPSERSDRGEPERRTRGSGLDREPGASRRLGLRAAALLAAAGALASAAPRAAEASASAAGTAPSDVPPGVTALLVGLAGLLAASVLAGSLLPSHRDGSGAMGWDEDPDARPGAPAQSTPPGSSSASGSSPDLAIR